MTLRPSTSATRRTTGSAGRSSPPRPVFAGLIDDFRVYNRALTAAEITALP